MGVRGQTRLPFPNTVEPVVCYTVVPPDFSLPLHFWVSAPPSLLLVIDLFLVPDKELNKVVRGT